MRKFYAHLSKLAFIPFLVLMAHATQAQTTLVKGDIAITGFIGNGTVAGNDQFSFMLLRNITTGTVINFTDNGWLRTSATTGSWNTTNVEGTVTWTSNAAYNAGAEIKIEITGTTTATATYAGLGLSAGTAIGTSMPSFSANGDQIIAYQGAVATPTFITAIHFNSYNNAIAAEPITNTTNWDGTYATANACGLPALTSVSPTNFLTNGVDAIWIFNSPTVEFDNARFDCSGTLNTIAGIRAAIYVTANWSASFDNDAPSFTLPTNCNFVGQFIPVTLISFQAKNNLNNVDVQWEVANQLNVSHYEVERSFDNITFDKVGMVAAQPGTGNITYNYKDMESLKSNANIIYYRLKSVDLDAKFSYSEIVNIRNKKDVTLSVDNLTNPVKNNLTFTLASKNAGLVQLQLIDMSGKILATRSLQVAAGSNTTINMPEAATLAQGMYFLKLSNAGETTVSRFIK